MKLPRARFLLGGQDMLGSVVRLPNPPWAVLVSEPIDSAYQQISILSYVLVAGACLAIFVSLGTSLLLARRLAGRFEAITAQAGLIAKGDYEASPPKESILEFNNLAHSLRGMADAIGDRERALTMSESKYRDVVEGTEDLIMRCDRDGILTYVNHASLNILGLTPQECIGRPALEFVHPDDRAMTTRMINKLAAEDATTSSFENRMINSAGRARQSVLEHDDTTRCSRSGAGVCQHCARYD